MKILHAPVEVAGQMSILCKELRKQGFDATSVNYYKRWIKYECDINLNIEGAGSIIDRLKMFRFFLNWPSYDIFHFYFTKSLLPKNLDLPILKLFNKKIILHLHGSDIRNSEYLYYLNDKFAGIPVKIIPPISSSKQQIKLFHIKKYANNVLVSTPDLLDITGKDAIYLPAALDIEKLKSNKKSTKNDKITILHSPTDRRKKGTEFIIKAVKKLQKEGHKIRLNLIEKISHNKTIELYREADIVVDQLLIGWYGLSSIESMGLGKPVLCYIRNDLKKYAPDLPIMDTNPNDVYRNLKTLAMDNKLREELGKRGIEYVKKNHDVKTIVKKLIKIYKES